MMKHTVVELVGRDSVTDPLTEMLRQGAKHLSKQAVEAELQALLIEHTDHCQGANPCSLTPSARHALRSSIAAYSAVSLS
jgi:hypothetical protein